MMTPKSTFKSSPHNDPQCPTGIDFTLPTVWAIKPHGLQPLSGAYTEMVSFINTLNETSSPSLIDEAHSESSLYGNTSAKLHEVPAVLVNEEPGSEHLYGERVISSSSLSRESAPLSLGQGEGVRSLEITDSPIQSGIVASSVNTLTKEDGYDKPVRPLNRFLTNDLKDKPSIYREVNAESFINNENLYGMQNEQIGRGVQSRTRSLQTLPQRGPQRADFDTRTQKSSSRDSTWQSSLDQRMDEMETFIINGQGLWHWMIREIFPPDVFS